MENTFLYFVLCIALYIITARLLHRIRNLPPSPFPSLPILGHLYLLKKPVYKSLIKVSQKHGPIMLLNFGSRRVLLVSSPELVEECLTKNDIIFANRPKLLNGKHLAYDYTSLVWSPYGDHWRNLRKISSVEVLSTHRLQTLNNIRADEARALVHQLKQATTAVNMKQALFELTMNIMMRMISGKRYIGDRVEDKEDAKHFQEILRDTFRLSLITNLGDHIPILRRLDIGSIEKKLKDLHKKRDAFMQRLVDEHKHHKDTDEHQNNRQKTLIQVLLSLQEKEPEYYTDTLIKNLMLTLVSAGTDTSSGTMEWALSLLVNNPNSLKKAQTEIDAVVGSERLIEESDLPNLPYLHAIIMETLRMYPPVPSSVPHESSADCTVGGYNVPRGTMLLANIWEIQHDERLWEDPMEFKPERFEGMSVGTERVGYKLLPFGSGRRSCPGVGLGLRMVGLGIGCVLQCFELERVGDGLEDMTENQGVTLQKAVELLVKCRPRENMERLLDQIVF